MILHPINTLPTNGDIPERMNNPFDYTPHPLCIQACQELQANLSQREDWQEEIGKGKMFGVLIVEKAGEIGYLSAYSGQIGGRSDWDDFVPAVFDYLQPDGYFKTHEAEISHINQAILRLEKDERMNVAKSQIDLLQKTRKDTIEAYQQKIKEAKTKRDVRRQEIQDTLSGKELSEEEKNAIHEEEQAMIKESQFMKAELHRLKKSLKEKTTLEVEYTDYLENIARLKQLRKQLSDALQQWLFSQFRMQNHKGERKDLLEIFKDTSAKVPPAGSGECCEPKLLQYAYEHGYRPLQIAMFWWGESPKEEIRHHLHFYPACNGKCKPILQWMLPENIVSPAHPSIYNKVETSIALETLYEDRELAVICKPAGMLSVPGKDVYQTSVYTLMRKKYPEATGPLIVHRLDMATSGLMVIAKTEFAYHRLQNQFSFHHIQKKYIAIVGCEDEDACRKIRQGGIIRLPLMPDYLDRPRQIVSHEHGKEAITEWKLLKEIPASELPCSLDAGVQMHFFRLALYPKTGRTHQLRVHCAHHEGLNAPILGDPLYGNQNEPRLYLHAESINFQHPLTREEMEFCRKADF